MKSRSIRFRITAIATLAVAAVLLIGGAALLLLQRNSLTASLDHALAQRADDVESLIMSGGDLPEELAAGQIEGFAQVVDEAGEVIVATANLAGSPPLPIRPPRRSGDEFLIVDGLEIDDDTFRVLTRIIEGVGVLRVGTSYDVVAEGAWALLRSLAIIVPILVVALAAVVWWLVGRTLEPVERIRAEVAEIESSQLDIRVPVPETGDEINRLAMTMNEMLERVELSVDRQQRFVADASHELRSPLTRLRAELEVVAAETQDPAEKATLAGFLDEVISLQHLVGDLLYLARADAGHGAGQALPVDLDDIVLREARRIQSRERVQLDLTRVSGAHIRGDGGQMSRLVRNLLENAERHATSRVSISLQEEDGEAVLLVSDDGAGIPAEDVDRIFERFRRLDESRSASTGGSGLGLAIAKEIIERHHGTITVSGQSGATFEVRIPLAV